MDGIHWQLSVLSKAVHYKNLSGASAHVGVSQPQLSRIVSRLEADLGVVLLDRTARRKSGWTPIAFKISETYTRTSRKLAQSIEQLKADSHPTHLAIGTLEGLMGLASDFCSQVLTDPRLTHVELNVYDLSELEEKFMRDEVDLVFTSREPGRHKHRYVRSLGYQLFEKRQHEGGPRVLSPYEFANAAQSSSKGSLKSNRNSQILISNSLAVRRLWIEAHGGSGSIPSEFRKRKTSDADTPVVLVASDLMNPGLWARLEEVRL